MKGKVINLKTIRTCRKNNPGFYTTTSVQPKYLMHFDECSEYHFEICKYIIDTYKYINMENYFSKCWIDRAVFVRQC